MKVEIDLPNEGPVVHGLVQLPDGGVLPPFVVHIKCSQCGKYADDLAFILKDKPCPCGRSGVTQLGEPT